MYQGLPDATMQNMFLNDEQPLDLFQFLYKQIGNGIHFDRQLRNYPQGRPLGFWSCAQLLNEPAGQGTYGQHNGFRTIQYLPPGSIWQEIETVWFFAPAEPQIGWVV